MYNLNEAKIIWNRACSQECSGSGVGDRALSALIGAHGLVMNGGVLHAVECLPDSEFADALSGYRFFGLGAVAGILTDARKNLNAGNSGSYERALDSEYAAHIPDDQFLVGRLEDYLRSNPSDFSPL